MPTTKIRKSVPLDPADIDRIEHVNVDVAVRTVALRYAGPDGISSETALLHALIRAGLAAIEREADDERYLQLAVAHDDEDRAYHQAMRNRRPDAA